MELKKLCIENLNIAIDLNLEIKRLVCENEITEAINVLADLLYVLGQTLLCINRTEFDQMLDAHEHLYKGKIKSCETAINPLENMCLQLIDAGINNLQQAKQYIKQNRLEDAENIIAATITGRVLRCLNSLKQNEPYSHPPLCKPSKKYKRA